MEALSSCDRDHMACKAYSSYPLALYRSLLTSNIEKGEMNVKGATGSLYRSKELGKQVSHCVGNAVRSLFLGRRVTRGRVSWYARDCWRSSVERKI